MIVLAVVNGTDGHLFEGSAERTHRFNGDVVISTHTTVDTAVDTARRIHGYTGKFTVHLPNDVTYNIGPAHPEPPS